MSAQDVDYWVENDMLLEEALRHLAVRSQIRCDKPLYWSLIDVGAVRLVLRRAKELGFLEEAR